MSYSTSHILLSDSFSDGSFDWSAGGWSNFEIRHPASFRSTDRNSYIVPSLPIEFHCHGISDFDFSRFDPAVIEPIERHLETIGCRCVLTGFLPRDRIARFRDFCTELAAQKRAGAVNHIIGVALEGPALSSIGGTADDGNWLPTQAEWEAIATDNPVLEYVVLSPDMLHPASPLLRHRTAATPEVDWIMALFAATGVAPSIGHVLHTAPGATARAIRDMVEAYVDAPTTLPRRAVVTDHLFNDMPKRFKHAWRSRSEKNSRDVEVQQLRIEEWQRENVVSVLGEVPGTILQLAFAGLVVPSLNFDGDHVDLAICRKVVDLVGADRLIAMTDLVAASRMLCGKTLSMSFENTLMYQDGGIVAAGSQGIFRQMTNIRATGVSEHTVWQLSTFTPASVLRGAEKVPVSSPPSRFVMVNERGAFAPFHLGSPSATPRAR